MEAIILLGAPGSGKGTAAESLREKTSFLHVATGDMLRAAVKGGTDLGKEAESYMKAGELVPDVLIIRLVEERLDSGAPDDRYMFDGFPRTVAQAELLDTAFDRRGGVVRKVFFLDTPREVLIKRLTGRRICRQCGKNYHVVNVPPQVESVCDVCGGELYQRPDDRQGTIENRLEVFNRQTESLIERYREKGLLERVNSDQGIDTLVSDIMKIL
ncbi:MAG: adenylate kinase [Lentisphaerae bacterium]|nr:adenylate kinase [Lentisphaerota bacterium]